MRSLIRLAIAAFFLAASSAAAEVVATEAWVRGTVPGQHTTGAFVTLRASEAAKLVGVSSPAAKLAELHTSEPSGGVMRMHAVDAIALPAGQRVELKPGGYHVMLIDLKKQVRAGDRVPLSFEVEDAKGRRSRVQVSAEVRPLGR
jgi:copper(I)-binding protein